MESIIVSKLIRFFEHWPPKKIWRFYTNDVLIVLIVLVVGVPMVRVSWRIFKWPKTAVNAVHRREITPEEEARLIKLDNWLVEHKRMRKAFRP